MYSRILIPFIHQIYEDCDNFSDFYHKNCKIYLERGVNNNVIEYEQLVIRSNYRSSLRSFMLTVLPDAIICEEV